MPAWLTLMLLAAGLLIGLAFAAEAILAIRRRRQQAALACTLQRRRAETATGPDSTSPDSAGSGSAGPGAEQARILLADHERVVVTRNKHDDTICVLRPQAKTQWRSCGSPASCCPKNRTGSWPNSSRCRPAGR